MVSIERCHPWCSGKKAATGHSERMGVAMCSDPYLRPLKLEFYRTFTWHETFFLF